MRLGVVADIHGNAAALDAAAAAAAGDVALVGKMSGAIGWTQGALCQAGLDDLEDLASEQRIMLPDQSVLLGVHASLGRDDGPGIDPRSSDDELAAMLAGCDADTVVGGHTHQPTDRTVGGVRALNPGSTGLPRESGGACWMLIDAGASGVQVEHRRAAFDVEATINDLQQRRYPNAHFLATVLRGTHVFG
jgi:predicted phosphodiesterase